MHKRVLALFLLVGMTFLSSIFALQGALLSDIVREWSLSGSNQGLPNTAAFIGGIISLAVTFACGGSLRKWLLLFACMAGGALCLMILWLPGPWALFVAVWFVLGMCIGWLDTLLSACMADLYEGEKLTGMMCVLHTFFGIASMLSPMLFRAMLNGGLAWRTAYLPVAGLGVLLAVGALALFLSGGVLKETFLRRGGSSGGNILAMVRKGGLVPLMIAMVFHGIFLSGLNTWVNRFAEGFDRAIPLMPAMSYLFFGVLFSRLLMPMTPLKPEKYVRFGGLLSAAALCGGVLSGGGLPLGICVTLSGLLFGAMLPCLLALACARLSENTLAATTALMLSYYVGEAVASPMVGALDGAFGLRAGMLALAACMCLCSVTMLLCRAKTEK